MLRLIGVTGYAQHGKDSTANILVDRYEYEQYAFADALKSMAITLNPFIPNKGEPWCRLQGIVEAEGWEGAKQIPEVRRFLQVLGTEGARDHLGDDVWLRAMETTLGYKLEDRRSRIVISDVRFPNEAEWIKSFGGEVWRVIRYAEGTELFNNGIGKDHPSEMYVDKLPVDATLRAHDLKELAEAVEGTMDWYARRT